MSKKPGSSDISWRFFADPTALIKVGSLFGTGFAIVALLTARADDPIMNGTDIYMIGLDNSDSAFSGTIINTGNGWDPVYGIVVKAGTGTLTIDGATIRFGQTFIIGGAMAQTSGTTSIDYLAVGSLTANNQPNVGVLNVSGGTISFGTTLQVGDWRGTGTVVQSGGTVIVTPTCGVEARCAALNIGNQGGTGLYTLSAGSLELTNATMSVGRNTAGNPASTGTLNIEGSGAMSLKDGSSLALGNREIIGTGDNGSSGTINQTGGTLTIDGTSSLFLSGSGNGIYNLSGGTLQIGGSSLIGSFNNLGGTYVLNLGGGTIQVIGSALTANVNATLGAGTTSTIDSNGLDATWSGVLSGAGTLNKIGSGSLILTGINTYTGSTSIQAGGTLALAAGGSIGASSGVIADGTFDIAATADGAFITSLTGSGTVALGTQSLTLTHANGIFSGTITGTGEITLTNGNLILAGANTYSGGTGLQGGTLTVGASDALGTGTLAMAEGTTLGFSGTYRINNDIIISGTPVIDVVSGQTATISSVISDGSNAGGIIKTGKGTLLLTAANAYTGTTSIYDGTLMLDGAIGTLQVNQGTTLAGTGRVGTTTIFSGGTLSPGHNNTIGVLTVNGNLTLAAGSTYVVDVTNTGTSDLVQVTGTATLNPGAGLRILSDGPWNLSTRYTILTAATGVNGIFTDTVAADFTFLTPSLSYDANNVYLAFSRNGRPFNSVATTRNQAASASALNTLTGGALYNAIVQLDAATARSAFDQLSGELYASVKSVLIDDSRFVRNASIDRLRVAFGSVAATPGPTTADANPAGDTDAAFWVQGFGSWGQRDNDGNAASLSHSIGGLFVGSDTPVFDRWRLGALTGYSRTSFRAHARHSSGHANNYHIGLYGGTQWGNLGLRLGTAYTWSDISIRRSVAFTTFSDRLARDYRAGSAQAFGELGYRIDAGRTPAGRLSFEPFAGVAYVNLRSAGSTEQGGAAALLGRSDNTGVTFSTLGLRSSTIFTVGNTDLTANATLGWRHAWGDINPTATFAFTGSDPFSIAGVPITRNAALAEVGVSTFLARNISLDINYTGQFSSGIRSQGVRGSLQWKF